MTHREAPIERINRVWTDLDGPHGPSIPQLTVALAREIQAAVKQEREDIVSCIRSTTWGGTEEIASMIRGREPR